MNHLNHPIWREASRSSWSELILRGLQQLRWFSSGRSMFFLRWSHVARSHSFRALLVAVPHNKFVNLEYWPLRWVPLKGIWWVYGWWEVRYVWRLDHFYSTAKDALRQVLWTLWRGAYRWRKLALCRPTPLLLLEEVANIDGIWGGTTIIFQVIELYRCWVWHPIVHRPVIRVIIHCSNIHFLMLAIGFN